jgi:hypothetical protein
MLLPLVHTHLRVVRKEVCPELNGHWMEEKGIINQFHVHMVIGVFIGQLVQSTIHYFDRQEGDILENIGGIHPLLQAHLVSQYVRDFM